jgi:hypothetical protein
MEPESAEIAESACRLFTSPGWGASTVGPTSAVDGWNGPNSGWRSRLSLERCRRARGWWAVEVDGTSAGGGGSGWLVAGGGSGAGSGVGVWARAQAQTSSAMTTTPIANPTLTADPGCTILRRGLACWLDSTSATAPQEGLGQTRSPSLRRSSQPTSEGFTDPASGKSMRVWYNPATTRSRWAARGSLVG